MLIICARLSYMNELIFFQLKFCPYCIRVHKYLKELLQEERYRSIKIRHVDEKKEAAFADQHDYYLVPTFYLGDTKLFEGIMTKQDVIDVLEKALASA